MKIDLVIVESPAKARTLEKILGKGYKLKASKGHVRDLPKSRIGVDVEHDFEPKYVVARDKSKAVSELKAAAKDAAMVYLATDPDREGEAIAWHLAEVIKNGKPALRRVVFHEITQSAIEQAFKHPRDINMNMVNAQQARRILDRLVGYKLSPLLWNKIRRGLSAGRVQSVAVKIIVEREREIEKFKPVEFWTMAAELAKAPADKPVFKASLVGLTNGSKLEIPDSKTAEAIEGELKDASYSVLKMTTKRTKRTPAPPFITSTLQQEAWRRFRFSAKRTMALAQQLYEGLALGSEGETGLITYMRTDSIHVAQQAITETREFVRIKYGNEYLPARSRIFSRKVKGAQEAHEAIRPTKINREPALIKPHLTLDQFKLYQLIWQRMVASQMAEAVFDNTTVDIEANNQRSKTRYLLRTLNSVNLFQGFSALYAEKQDEEEEDKKASVLPPLNKGDALKLIDLKSEQNFTKPPPRFTEATLIKILEQNGIGRPSTYAPIISTIQEREYVIREAGTFKPTELGMLVTDMLVQNFDDIVNIDYTAQIESKLDQIANEKADWVAVVREFYDPLISDLEKANASVEKIKLADEPAGENCPNCDKPMLIKIGGFGKFIACSDYPTCKTTKPFQIKTGVPCPDCPEKGELVGRFNKKGKIFYGCNAYPRHKFALNARPLAKPCPECGGLLTEYGKSERCTKCRYKGKKTD